MTTCIHDEVGRVQCDECGEIYGTSERFGFIVLTGRYKILDYHKTDGQQIATANDEDAARLIIRALNHEHGKRARV